MIARLEHAIEAVTALPPEERVALARFFLPDDPEVEARWDRLFADSAESLGAIANQVLADHAAGRTERLDPSKL